MSLIYDLCCCVCFFCVMCIVCLLRALFCLVFNCCMFFVYVVVWFFSVWVLYYICVLSKVYVLLFEICFGAGVHVFVYMHVVV